MKIIIATATLSSHSILLPGWIQAYLLVPRCLAQKVTESIKAIKGWNVNSMTSWKKFKRIAEKKNSNIFFLRKKIFFFLVLSISFCGNMLGSIPTHWRGRGVWCEWRERVSMKKVENVYAWARIYHIVYTMGGPSRKNSMFFQKLKISACIWSINIKIMQFLLLSIEKVLYMSIVVLYFKRQKGCLGVLKNSTFEHFTFFMLQNERVYLRERKSSL